MFSLLCCFKPAYSNFSYCGEHFFVECLICKSFGLKMSAKGINVNVKVEILKNVSSFL